MMKFLAHHTALSVADIERSVSFYEFFGYRKVLTWEALDGSLSIGHLRNEQAHMLELVCYADASTIPPPGVGNDLNEIGVKHIAFHVDDVQAARDEIVARELGEVTELTAGRTQMELFFVRDPDGLWVEVLKDDRRLSPEHPALIQEEPRLLEGE
jgi:catechol 2,3-dioxygenase-like lactoylglutathione lyase family enzyme